MSSTSRTAILLPFSEAHDDVWPTDRAGNVKDMTGDASTSPALVRPVVTEGLLGYARQFGDDIGLVAAEEVAGSTLLTRDLTIEAIVNYDIASATGAGCIIQRGKGGSAAERVVWGLRLDKYSSTEADLVLYWREVGSTTDVDVAGVRFTVPTGWLYLWVIRRWRSATEVECIFGINDNEVSRVTETAGDIGDGTGGSVLVGCRYNTTGPVYEDFFEGKIDQIRVSNEARSVEELRHQHRRIFSLQSQGYEIIKSCLPAGRVYSDDPSSGIQLELQVEGDALSEAMAMIEELRDGYSPATAWTLLTRWESIFQLPPRYDDTIETRRDRVLGFARKVHGSTLDAIKLELEKSLALDSADIEIVEHVNEYTDGFATLSASAWGIDAGDGAIAIDTGELKFTMSITDDGRWITSKTQRAYQSLDGSVDESDPYVGFDATVKLSSYTLVNDVMAGILVYDSMSRDVMLLGYYRTGGVTDFGYRVYADGAWGAFVSLDATPPSTPQWIRLRYDGAGVYTAFYNGTGPDDVSNETAIATGVQSPNFCGLGVVEFTGSCAGAVDVRFDDWRLYQPMGLAVFNWYAYRDPALSGTADLRGAHATVEKVKPAHTFGAAVQSKVAVFDNATSLFDRTPLGG